MAMAKTEAGLRMLKDRRSGLPPRQRAALILIDGQRSIDDLLAATSAGGITRADVDRLIELGLVAEQLDSMPARIRTDSPDFMDSSSMGWGQYVRAYGVATELSAELARKDVQLALAIEAAGSLDELEALAPRIRAAVGDIRYARLEAALKAR